MPPQHKKSMAIGALRSSRLASLSRSRLGEVPRVLLQRPACVLERGLLAGTCFADFGTANLVESVVGEPLNVEAVEDDRGARNGLANRLDVRPRHVDGDGFDLPRTLLSKRRKEGFDRLRASSLRSPHDDSTLVVHDGRDVLVVLSVADLVYADDPEVVEWIAHLGSLAADEAANDLPHGPPRDAHERRHSRLVGPLRVVGDVILHRQGETASGLCPRHVLDDNPPCLAANAPNPIPEHGLDPGEVEMTPTPGPVVMGPTTLAAAPTAPGQLPSRGDVGNESILVEPDIDDAGVLEREEGGAHAGWAGLVWCRNRKVTPSPAAHFFTPPNLLSRFVSDSCARSGPDRRPLNRQESPKSRDGGVRRGAWT